MAAYDDAGVPYFAGVGNHDRDAPPGAAGGVPPPGGLIATTARSSSDRPYPMGDAAPYDDPRSRPRERPADDPDGAASHYFVDVGNVRWIFIDNSCWSITLRHASRPVAQTSAGDASSTSSARRAGGHATPGRLVFVVMHMPTQDPRDQSYRTRPRACT